MPCFCKYLYIYTSSLCDLFKCELWEMTKGGEWMDYLVIRLLLLMVIRLRHGIESGCSGCCRLWRYKRWFRCKGSHWWFGSVMIITSTTVSCYWWRWGWCGWRIKRLLHAVDGNVTHSRSWYLMFVSWWMQGLGSLFFIIFLLLLLLLFILSKFLEILVR